MLLSIEMEFSPYFNLEGPFSELKLTIHKGKLDNYINNSLHFVRKYARILHVSVLRSKQFSESVARGIL